MLKEKVTVLNGFTNLNIEDNQDVLLNLEEDSCWLILRCMKCNKKSIPMITQGNIAPTIRYCRHCGCDKFYIQKRKDIERLDTIYALYSKDLLKVRKEMVSRGAASLDTAFNKPYISQSMTNAWNKQSVAFADNVIPFEKYYSKK